MREDNRRMHDMIKKMNEEISVSDEVCRRFKEPQIRRRWLRLGQQRKKQSSNKNLKKILLSFPL